MHTRRDIGILGAGSFGTCLAKLLGDNDHRVTLWCRSSTVAKQIQESRENVEYLPGCRLAESVQITEVLEQCVADKEILIGVTPSHAIRAVLTQVRQSLSPEVIMVNASKGLEEDTLARIDQIYDTVLPRQIAHRAVFLSGPAFAQEIAKGLPSAIAAAGRDSGTMYQVQQSLSSDRFRIYTCADVVGLLLGGALKNIAAIATGISDGCGFGDNARAALITRCLAEIARIGIPLGADPLTFSGLSGVGDLMLTCFGDLSRNRRVGLALGRGQSLAEVEAQMSMVAEGVRTTKVASALATSIGVEVPIIQGTYSVLFEGQSPRNVIAGFMGRPLKSERE